MVKGRIKRRSYRKVEERKGERERERVRGERWRDGRKEQRGGRVECSKGEREGRQSGGKVRGAEG